MTPPCLSPELDHLFPGCHVFIFLDLLSHLGGVFPPLAFEKEIGSTLVRCCMKVLPSLTLG